jgi:hypothetical protein
MCCFTVVAVQAGVQYVPTEFQQLTGPEEDLRLKVGDEMTFNWEFDGFGDQYCYNDGKLYNNMGDYNCNSPAQIRIPDRWNHTFRIALQVRVAWVAVLDSPAYVLCILQPLRPP